MNRSVPFVTAIFALTDIMLGIIGYREAGSAISLFSGVISGLILLFCLYFMVIRRAWAYVLGAVVSAILLIAFGVRFAKTVSFMPGAMAIFSMILLALLSSEAITLIRKK